MRWLLIFSGGFVIPFGFFFSSRRRHTRCGRDWSSDVCSSDLSERREVQHVHSPAADWRRALELLAAVEPTGQTPVARLLAQDTGPAARALELAVVTARVEVAVVQAGDDLAARLEGQVVAEVTRA